MTTLEPQDATEGQEWGSPPVERGREVGGGYAAARLRLLQEKPPSGPERRTALARPVSYTHLTLPTN